MNFYDYIAIKIKGIIPEDLPVYFWWNYQQCTDEHYVVYQTENLSVRKKRCKSWIDFMDNAVKVYDFSMMNKRHYSSKFLPLYPNPNTEYNGTGEIDVLFYGYITPRRQRIIDKLGATVVKTHDMEQLEHFIAKSKYVLSVGCYDNVYADPLRICTALDMGANIIMERTHETWLYDYLKIHHPTRITTLP